LNDTVVAASKLKYKVGLKADTIMKLQVEIKNKTKLKLTQKLK